MFTLTSQLFQLLVVVSQHNVISCLLPSLLTECSKKRKNLVEPRRESGRRKGGEEGRRRGGEPGGGEEGNLGGGEEGSLGGGEEGRRGGGYNSCYLNNDLNNDLNFWFPVNCFDHKSLRRSTAYVHEWDLERDKPHLHYWPI